MSRYDWEAGTIKIPAAEWVGFKKALRNAWAEEQERRLKLAEKLYEELVAAGKGRRNFNYVGALNGLLDQPRYREVDELGTSFEYALFKDVKTEPGKHPKPRKPKKADFPLPNSKTLSFSAGYDGHISLIEETRSVRWAVSENNRAVEDARDSVMGRKLFALLARMTWVRGSGGSLVGNDEYNRESRDYGGGSNYVTACYGPLGKQ